MSRFSGPQHRGAGRAYRDSLRSEAVGRAAATLPEATRRAILASRTGVAKTARELQVSEAIVTAIWAKGQAA